MTLIDEAAVERVLEKHLGKAATARSQRAVAKEILAERQRLVTEIEQI